MEVLSKSVSQTLYIGKEIAKNLRKGDIICLCGQLGSGKTVLVKGIAKGLGINEKKVISPSFVLVREHLKARLPLYHFDLYRLEEPTQILALGIEGYFYGAGASVIEWAERLKYLLPKDFLKVELSLKSGSKRLLKFSACGKRYKELLKKIHENISH